MKLTYTAIDDRRSITSEVLLSPYRLIILGSVAIYKLNGGTEDKDDL